jgi:CPA1 family monovalent cation:H+ antiporter
MSLFDVVAILLLLTAVIGYLNSRYLQLPPSVGLLIISLGSSLGVMLLHWAFPGLGLIAVIRDYFDNIDFNEALMHGMLGFLLFAGALHADLDYFAQRRWTIALLATVGLLISTALIGLMSHFIFAWLGYAVPWLVCLLFGALISPTDPISVMGTLKTLHAPPRLEAKIAGESLFNDGVAVVVFTALLEMLHSSIGGSAVPLGAAATHGAVADSLGVAAAHLHASGPLGVLDIAWLFVREAGGGIVLGFLSGFLAYRMMLAIDDYKVEVLITIALVMASYALAMRLHISGPIAVVVSGLLIGNRGRSYAMSDTVADYLEKFWELIDEILNAVLFLLIGVEVIVVNFQARGALAGLISIGVVLLARFVSVALPIRLMRRWADFSDGVIRILTWAGLRGGISVALVLSLPPIPQKQLLLTCTYVVVLFSILVQGTTVSRVLKRYL